MKVVLGEQTWELDTETLLNTEAILIEQQTGWNLAEWADALNNRSMIAITCVVWLAQRRQDPTLKFEDITFDLASFTIEGDTDDPKDDPTET